MAVTRSMVGVLGDMADCIDNIGPAFAGKTVYKQFLDECNRSGDSRLRETAMWASGRIQAQVGHA
jgi:importin subunit beta-1